VEPNRWNSVRDNTPYEDNQDVQFIDHALACSARVVGIFQSRIVHSAGRANFWRWVDIARLAILSKRPHFGGPHSAKTDFCVMELRRRASARRQGEPTAAQLEWWVRSWRKARPPRPRLIAPLGN
jgi:hypothetical protein